MKDAYEAFQEGSRLLNSGDAHPAVVLLERARELEPEQGSIRETLARAYFCTGRFAASAAEFAKTLELDPVNDYALYGLGMCALRTNDLENAMRNLRLAVAMRPESADYQNALREARARVTHDPHPGLE
ncbi:MAG: tetratricopeptide repeat protein [Acidimicrobiia bacterium]